MNWMALDKGKNHATESLTHGEKQGKKTKNL